MPQDTSRNRRPAISHISTVQRMSEYLPAALRAAFIVPPRQRKRLTPSRAFPWTTQSGRTRAKSLTRPAARDEYAPRVVSADEFVDDIVIRRAPPDGPRRAQYRPLAWVAGAAVQASRRAMRRSRRLRCWGWASGARGRHRGRRLLRHARRAPRHHRLIRGPGG